MAQLKKAVTERLGQRLTMILAISQLDQTTKHRSVVAGIALLEFIKKLPHRRTSVDRFVKLYFKLHKTATSNLMFRPFRLKVKHSATEEQTINHANYELRLFHFVFPAFSCGKFRMLSPQAGLDSRVIQMPFPSRLTFPARRG
jgi:hypothetical protein